MDQAALDRLCDELRSRRKSRGDAAAEMARLRAAGYSVVQAMYIIGRVFDLSVRDAKSLAVAVESGEYLAEIEAVHDSLEKSLLG